MNLRELAETWLRDNGFDGLAGDECGCDLEYLMACGEPDQNCQPGYKIPCPGPEACPADGDCPWHISPTKGGD